MSKNIEAIAIRNIKKAEKEEAARVAKIKREQSILRHASSELGEFEIRLFEMFLKIGFAPYSARALAKARTVCAD